MFSFVDIRLALLLSAAVLLARGQGEDDRKYLFHTLIWLVWGLVAPRDVDRARGCCAGCWDWLSSAGSLAPVMGMRCNSVRLQASRNSLTWIVLIGLLLSLSLPDVHAHARCASSCWSADLRGAADRTVGSGRVEAEHKHLNIWRKKGENALNEILMILYLEIRFRESYSPLCQYVPHTPFRSLASQQLPLHQRGGSRSLLRNKTWQWRLFLTFKGFKSFCRKKSFGKLPYTIKQHFPCLH